MDNNAQLNQKTPDVAVTKTEASTQKLNDLIQFACRSGRLP